MLLMVLEYLREYRTYFHIGQSYGMSESNCFKIIIPILTAEQTDRQQWKKSHTKLSVIARYKWH